MADETITDQYEPESRLHEAIVSFEQARDAGHHPNPQEWLTRYPEVACQLADFFADQEQLHRLAGPLRPPNGKVDASADSVLSPVDQNFTPAPNCPSTASETRAGGGMRYVELVFHAAGGLGEVYKAKDTELGRQVAIKRMKGDFVRDTDIRLRFLREAEITARLDHPGVVPVYGLVNDKDGQPCYAMRFIEGESLRDAIYKFHEAEKTRRDPSERSLALLQLMTQFVAVCKTIAYAHSRGIIHRDIKPANVMLGKYGETLVVDWGLAKFRERQEEEKEQDEPSLRPSLGSGAEGTQQGSAMGTPAYMSPEQASGLWDSVGPESDIYSLGATLYSLLAGRPPFHSLDPCDKVHRGEFPSPRSVKRNTPRALNAICMKAMSLYPEDRYRSASDLAKDVERWLADEPVSACREPWSARTRRWCERHWGLVGAGTTVALISVIALWLYLLLR